MEFSFTNTIKRSTIKNLLSRHGVSRRMLANVKYDGGKILVDGREESAIFRLKEGQKVIIQVPDEVGNDKLDAFDAPLQILFEDEHYLIVEKPAGLASIPGPNHPTGAMSNIVKSYIQKRGYANQAVHVITRLDRDTSGIMFFAKHRYAHALIMNDTYKDKVEKRYYAIVKDDGELEPKGELVYPIGRQEGSIIERRVHPEGKKCLTTYEVAKQKNGLNLLDVVLHTGRTHQIRVHFSYIGYPLLGDELYGGNHDQIERQALHCHHFEFLHPFINEKIKIESELPEDMKKLLAD